MDRLVGRWQGELPINVGPACNQIIQQPLLPEGVVAVDHDLLPGDHIAVGQRESAAQGDVQPPSASTPPAVRMNHRHFTARRRPASAS